MRKTLINKVRLSLTTFLILFISFLFGGLLYLNAATDPIKVGPRPIAQRGSLTEEELSTISIFERSKESVVFISTKQRVRDYWTRNVFSVPSGTGSGLIWDEQGHIITNYHVIKGSSEATVRLEDGRDYEASLIGVSPSHDLAVLKISIATQPPLPIPIGESDNLKVGQKVYAIGNPFGLDWTLTLGVVSALDRSLNNEGGQNIEHLIQTDAAINPGSSGGPLLDSAGRLIGINTAIYSPSGVSAGIGFAVPVDTINRVVPQLIQHKKYTLPNIGIHLDPAINRRITRTMGIQGIAILNVFPGSSAAHVGLQPARLRNDGVIVPGDIITKINGVSVPSARKYYSLMDNFKDGDDITISVHRHGETLNFIVSVATD